MSVEDRQTSDPASYELLNRPEVGLLTVTEERSLLLELGEFKRRLIQSRTSPTCSMNKESSAEPAVQDVVRDLLRLASTTGDSGQLVAVAVRYNELRTKLAMANLRLVAHVSRRYRNRGLSHSDLLQEGFCGLLKAIDRFDSTKETRLASYAVWWIRQALQRAVAAGAYPVRLNPRHLQQLAASNQELSHPRKPGSKARASGSVSTLRQIHSATRPTVALNLDLHAGPGSSLLNALAYPMDEDSPSGELGEVVGTMIQQLKPREQMVLQLRFGLGGKDCHSLSQVSEMLDVSKERIRQIQEAALGKLRSLAKEKAYCEATG